MQKLKLGKSYALINVLWCWVIFTKLLSLTLTVTKPQKTKEFPLLKTGTFLVCLEYKHG